MRMWKVKKQIVNFLKFILLWVQQRKRSCFLGALVVLLFAVLVCCVFWWQQIAVFMNQTITAPVAVGNQTFPVSPAQAAKPSSNLEIAYKLALAYAALVGFVFAWWRAYCLGKQTNVAEQGLITDRFIKATEQLGHEQESVRIGAIYSLWRIAVDSASEYDRRAILDMLCTYVRTPYADRKIKKLEEEVSDGSWGRAFPFRTHVEKEQEVEADGRSIIREDIKIILDLLVNRVNELNIKKYSFDLNNAQLSNAFLIKAFQNYDQGPAITGERFWLVLFEANLIKADLRYSNLKMADLEGTQLQMALLEGASLHGSIMRQANLEGSYLRKAYLVSTDLRGANLSGADLRGAYLDGANLRGAKLDGALFTGASFCQTRFSKKEQIANVSLEGVDLSGAIFLDEQKQTTPSQPSEQSPEE